MRGGLKWTLAETTERTDKLTRLGMVQTDECQGPETWGNQDLATRRPGDGRSRTKGARNGQSGCLMDSHRRGEKSYNKGARTGRRCGVLAVQSELSSAVLAGWAPENRCGWSLRWPQEQKGAKKGERHGTRWMKDSEEGGSSREGPGRDDEKCGGLLNAAACSSNRDPWSVWVLRQAQLDTALTPLAKRESFQLRCCAAPMARY